MQTIKQVGFWLAVIAFGCCVLFFAVTTAFERTLSTPTTIKTAVENSGLYDLVVDQITKETTTQIQIITGAPDNEPSINTAISNVVTSKLIQQNIEVVIDSIYLWLQGETDIPEFTLDLTNPKQNIAANLAEQGVLRVQALPACTPAQNLALQDTNPFTLKCKPAIDPEQLRSTYAQTILQNDEFTAITNITATDLTDEQGKSVFDNAQHIPNTFQTIALLPWLFFVAAAIAAIIAIVLHSSNIRALRILLVSLAVSGLLIVISGSSAAGFLSGKIPAPSNPDAQATQEALLAVATEVGAAISRTLLIIGGGALLLGSGGYVLTKRLAANTAAPLRNTDSAPPTHPEVGPDGRVYFMEGQPPTTQASPPYSRPSYPQTPPTPMPPAQPNPTPPQAPQPPTQPWQQPHPGEKKWWE